ncbi:hypothetical protein SSX86_019824 [Deinandra increscens subsp. villosa]|uniref:Ulp1 protease family, C-terminal catalytic domain-containing protein n=1 Tax=Deinandra increscens subsp. villosa TaxID=3103831 RepID=A0AAP0CTC5_9ASTR
MVSQDAGDSNVKEEPKITKPKSRVKSVRGKQNKEKVIKQGGIRKSGRVAKQRGISKFKNNEKCPVIVEEESSVNIDSESYGTAPKSDSESYGTAGSDFKMTSKTNESIESDSERTISKQNEIEKNDEAKGKKETKKRRREEDETSKGKKKVKKSVGKGKKFDGKGKKGAGKGKKAVGKGKKGVEKGKSDLDLKFPLLRTRSSPKKFSEFLNDLTERKKNIIREMGFGSLISMRVNGIPGRLAYFVVDHLDPKELKIIFDDRVINVDNDSIQLLLGVPNSGIDITSKKVKKKWTPLGTEYRKRYKNTNCSFNDVVKKAEEDGDDRMFKLDFIVLFVNGMVDCHKNGICKFGIVDLLDGISDFSDIDWCEFIVSRIKKCKDKFDINMPKDYFSGALTILVLLYVDSIICTGINEIRVTHPLEFWSYKKLKEREEIEIKRGKFGLGDQRGLYFDYAYDNVKTDEGGATKSDVSKTTTKTLENQEKSLFIFIREKSRLERSIAQAQKDFPESQEIVDFQNQYRLSLNETTHETEGDESEEEKEEEDESDGGSKQDKTEMEESKGEAEENKQKEKSEKLTEVDEAKNGTEVTEEALKRDEEQRKVDMIIKNVIDDGPSFELNIDSPIKMSNEMEIKEDDMVQKRKRPQRAKHTPDALGSPYAVREVEFLQNLTAKEKRVWNYIYDGAVKETKNKNEEAETDKEFAEVVKTFSHDMKVYEILLVPIIDKNHYYLICFDLKHEVIEVIDNMKEETSLVGLVDDPEYDLKDIVFKVKDVVVKYLRSVGNCVRAMVDHSITELRPYKKLVPLNVRVIRKYTLQWNPKDSKKGYYLLKDGHGNAIEARLETRSKKLDTQVSLYRCYRIDGYVVNPPMSFGKVVSQDTTIVIGDRTVFQHIPELPVPIPKQHFEFALHGALEDRAKKIQF